MKRRANGEGTVKQRRDGRWEIQLRLGDGRRQSLFGRTQREVMEKKAELLKTLAGGLPIVSDRQSFGGYLEGWLEAARPRLRARTHLRYTQLVRVHVIPRTPSDRGRTRR